MSPERIIQWIYAGAVSSAIRDTSWIIPSVQAVHICAISVVVGSALLIELRLAGLVATDETPYVVVRRYLPWMWRALALLLATGLVMVVGEPERVLGNRIFWLKMSLVLLAVIVSLLFRRPWLDPERGTQTGWRTLGVKPLAWVLLVVWAAVIFSGRWIAYTG